MQYEEPSSKQKMVNYICGDNKPKRRMTKEMMLELQEEATNITEDPKMKKILNINAVIALAVCVFLHGFFA